MKVRVTYAGRSYEVDLDKPIDISLPVDASSPGPNAFYAERPHFEPYRSGNFVASVQEGGSVNSYNVTFNPHGNGTHTECRGHITKAWEKITDTLQVSHYIAKLVSINPKERNGDQVVSKSQIEDVLQGHKVPQALIIRTIPNNTEKRVRKYSGQNPPYIEPEAMEVIVAKGIEHLLIDLPSVDREEDGGAVASHHIFWGLPSGQNRAHCTITELIYVQDGTEDGTYLLDLQRASFELDCAPSRPVLYELKLVE